MKTTPEQLALFREWALRMLPNICVNDRAVSDWLLDIGDDIDELTAKLAAAEREREQLQAEEQRLRKILAHVPGKVAIAAKEAAGFGAQIRAAEKRVDDRMEAQQAAYEMELDALHEGDDL